MSNHRLNQRIGYHIARLGDPDEKIAKRAAGYLFRYGERAKEAVIEASESENATVRWGVCHLISEFQDPRVFPILARYVDDTDDMVQFSSAIYLGEIHDSRVVPFLEERVERIDSDEEHRWFAPSLAGQGEEGFQALLRLLRSSNRHARECAAGSLDREERLPLWGWRVIDALAACVSDPSEDVRLAVTESLGPLAGWWKWQTTEYTVRVLELLTVLAGDEADKVRTTAQGYVRDLRRMMDGEPESKP